MKLLITGGTGFIGSALVSKFVPQADEIWILTRQNLPNHGNIRYLRYLDSLQHLNGFDAVINLAGEPIFDKRWTLARKQQLVDSRIHITQQISHLILKSEQPPPIFLSGSATGFYGDVRQPTDEQQLGDNSFTHQLCQAWETKALLAQTHSRVCLLRTGLVIAPEGGLLARLKPIYRLGLGGKLGNGQQHWAWIALEDYLQAVLFLLKNPTCHGAFNLVAPAPIRQADFNRLLAKRFHRPAYCHLPAIFIKTLLGERSQLLLDNQQILPTKLLNAGFQFTHTLTDCL